MPAHVSWQAAHENSYKGKSGSPEILSSQFSLVWLGSVNATRRQLYTHIYNAGTQYNELVYTLHTSNVHCTYMNWMHEIRAKKRVKFANIKMSQPKSQNEPRFSIGPCPNWARKVFQIIPMNGSIIWGECSRIRLLSSHVSLKHLFAGQQLKRDGIICIFDFNSWINQLLDPWAFITYI